MAQGRQDTLPNTHRSAEAIDVSHLSNRCTRNHDSLPRCKNADADADANADAMHANAANLPHSAMVKDCCADAKGRSEDCDAMRKFGG